jgi:hypothetical protein
VFNLPNLPLFSVGVLFFFSVASLGKILYLDHFVGSCGFVCVYLGQNHAWRARKITSRVFESKNNKHEHNGAGHKF